MSNDFLMGAWTYRSFLNRPDPIDDFNQIKFGQGEMVFEAYADTGTLRGQLAFRSSPPDPKDARLTLSGSVQLGDPFSVRFQGRGVEQTGAEGWIYDYIGWYVPRWPDGIDQRPAIVGSVIRTVPHGDRPAGVVGCFVAVQRDFVEPRDVIPLPDPVRDMLASRVHRLHHVVWHSVRGFWPRLEEEQRAAIRALGWQPGGKEERPGVRPDGAPMVTNGSGEDFLFMHRQMIGMVGQMMDKLKQPRIAGWPTIPAPDSLSVEPDFSSASPVLPAPGNPFGFSIPPAWVIPGDDATTRRIAQLKTDAQYWSRFRTWDREFKNAQYLATLTLGELGSLIEFSVHNDMHMRWTSIPRDPATGAPLPGGRADSDIRKLWDDPRYDYLGEFYSSHVNPVFWRLHGWVDDRIEDWWRAHEAQTPGEIETVTVGGVSWFRKGKWVHTDEPWAAPPSTHGEHGDHGMHGGMGQNLDIPTMEKVCAIIFGPSPADDAEMMKATPALSIAAAPATAAGLRGARLTWF